MTRDEIITEVVNETKRTDKTTRLGLIFPDILYKMSRAITEDSEPIPLQDLKASDTDSTLSITDGDYYVSLPTGFIFQFAEPELYYDTDKGRILEKKSLAWMNYNYPNRANNSSNKSKPLFYCLEKNRFDFAPMSDGSYSIIFPFTKLHPAVTSNAVAILFRDHFKDVIKDLLKSQMFEELDDLEKAGNYATRGIGTLRTLAVLDRKNSGAELITNYNDY